MAIWNRSKKPVTPTRMQRIGDDAAALYISGIATMATLSAVKWIGQGVVAWFSGSGDQPKALPAGKPAAGPVQQAASSAPAQQVASAAPEGISDDAREVIVAFLQENGVKNTHLMKEETLLNRYKELKAPAEAAATA